ncbi:MAG TPA: peroxiredoxin [Zeimonas sp.]
MSVQVGSPIPAFRAASTGGEIDSAHLKGCTLVLYFYPKDNTPGCTRQGSDFRDRHDGFVEAGAVVLGVSRDSLKSHANFKAKLQFPFELVCDADETLCRAFDVLREKNLYGRRVLGVERSTFVVDADGRLAREWRGVRVPGHVDEVLDFVRSL